MFPVRAVFVPRLGSQRDEPQPDQTMNRTKSPSRYRGNKLGKVTGEKNRFLLKVKLQKLNSTVSKKVEETPRRWVEEHAANTTNTAVSQGDAADSDSVGQDVFFFTQRPTSTAVNMKDKAKLAVLRTISKMLDENQLIRQRLATVRQAYRGGID